jgi:predicted ATPase
METRMPTPLVSLQLGGFRSIKRLRLELSSDITLLIGANGAGKSNVVDAFELLGYAVDRRLQGYVLRSGGFGQMVHRSPTDGRTERITIEAWGDWNSGQTGRVRNGYRMSLTAGPEDSALLSETTFTHDDRYPNPYSSELGLTRESRLQEQATAHAANRYLLDVLAGCRVFHFDDTGFDAPPLKLVSVADSETLHDDARNLAAVLLDMRKEHPGNYQRVLRSIKNVAPFFDDFVLRPENESVGLRWREVGMDDVFPGSALSSGTLRFICLAVLLQQPRPPATIVLDEPELGLHPAAIHQLADLFRNAGHDRRIVAATQSVTLLAQFSLNEIAVVERTKGATTVSRPDPERLTAWLADYSVGELWEMNLLGGRPAGVGPAGKPEQR